MQSCTMQVKRGLLSDCLVHLQHMLLSPGLYEIISTSLQQTFTDCKNEKLGKQQNHLENKNHYRSWFLLVDKEMFQMYAETTLLSIDFRWVVSSFSLYRWCKNPGHSESQTVQNISQGSEATRLRCGCGMVFNGNFIVNLLASLNIDVIWNQSVGISRGALTDNNTVAPCFFSQWIITFYCTSRISFISFCLLFVLFFVPLVLIFHPVSCTVDGTDYFYFHHPLPLNECKMHLSSLLCVNVKCC